ncbi:CBS domain containing-hemolysin-like protein [Clostridium saccharoperbutylacetonicum]|uniref:CBS domain-containing protein n=1 Tax=Clostridium saccharoperbutylacetonicum N1-4(HMT) TaxID=931276 RepID=M1MMB0_9CLOT|nr:hemolysin family protein [Clostridium saccharoperbutylacetonicum]AGF57358.1 CBS domain-containing protein [Clostridium saccharoperbutylacetonicum N1-4(HMT)]NRT61879.1 CBS domain containing-hemolysin-like protein [Clostridium saccharoperbutylacetonicum]NSB25205.1 CBS domain containing-hemolysin-like protein [Clostridium saccharoperbutylacetonicum]NSB44577.1 CBS domain containing-hemolysin-like protein [Clostridium saccharoperbutylacetonicum]
MITLINVIIVIFLVFMNGFFVATEFAMVKVRKSRVETLALDGNKNAKYTLKIVKDLNSYLSACQLGITLASLGLGWVGEPAFADMLRPLINLFNLPEITLHSIAVVLGFSIITALHIVLGELVPKSLAIISAEKIALYTALPLIGFYKITYPIMWSFNHSTNLVLKIFGISQVDEHEAAHTDEEIKLLVEDSYKHGLIDQTELTFVDNIFDFSEKTVREIMIPRTDMACVFIEDSFEEIIKYVLEEQLTRYPICKDSKDNVIGFIHIKDLFKLKIEGNENIEGIIREIKFVPESLSISELFTAFKEEKAQMAIIIDEFGGTSGLVTTEDILEEIVGEIQDEFDDDGEEDIIQTENGSYVVDGKVILSDINELLETDIQDENIDTIGGWIYFQLGSYPKVKQKFTYENYEFIILKCDRKRISKILIKKITE